MRLRKQRESPPKGGSYVFHNLYDLEFGWVKSFGIHLTTLHIKMCIKLLSPMSIETLMYCYESGRPSGKALLPKLSTQPYIAIKAISIMTIFKNIYNSM